MLVLTRKPKEKIDIGESIEIEILEFVFNDATGQVKGVKLGITAPSDVDIARRELKANSNLRIFKEEGQ